MVDDFVSNLLFAVANVVQRDRVAVRVQVLHTPTRRSLNTAQAVPSLLNPPIPPIH